MIAFDSPWLLYLAPVATAIIALLALWAYRARVSHAIRWSPELGRLARGVGRHGWVTPAFAAFFAVVALSGPRWGRRTVSAESKALNLVIAVDISRSMLAEDVVPFERAAWTVDPLGGEVRDGGVGAGMEFCHSQDFRRGGE